MSSTSLRRLMRVLCVAGALTLGGAAQSTVLAQASADAATPMAEERLEVIYSGSGTASQVEVETPIFTPVGQLTRLDLQVRNKTGRQRKFEYSIEWFDQSGVSVQTITAWQRVFLAPSGLETVRSVGQKVTAYRARMTIRLLRDSD